MFDLTEIFSYQGNRSFRRKNQDKQLSSSSQNIFKSIYSDSLSNFFYKSILLYSTISSFEQFLLPASINLNEVNMNNSDIANFDTNDRNPIWYCGSGKNVTDILFEIFYSLVTKDDGYDIHLRNRLLQIRLRLLDYSKRNQSISQSNCFYLCVPSVSDIPLETPFPNFKHILLLQFYRSDLDILEMREKSWKNSLKNKSSTKLGSKSDKSCRSSHKQSNKCYMNQLKKYNFGFDNPSDEDDDEFLADNILQAENKQEVHPKDASENSENYFYKEELETEAIEKIANDELSLSNLSTEMIPDLKDNEEFPNLTNINAETKNKTGLRDDENLNHQCNIFSSTESFQVVSNDIKNQINGSTENKQEFSYFSSCVIF